MKKFICDRCGQPHDLDARLVLIQNKFTYSGSTSRSHEFDLCSACARKVFGFIGQRTEKPIPPTTGSKVWR